MGYQRRVFNLVFDDPAYDGLEVRARSISIKAFRRVQAVSDEEGNTETLWRMAEEFAKALISWNLEDDGVPVPATLEGLEEQDPAFLDEVVSAWMAALTKVDDASPLDGPSDSGRRSLEESLTMEPLSESLAS